MAKIDPKRSASLEDRLEELARRVDLLERQVAHFLPKPPQAGAGSKRAPDEDVED